MTKVLVLYYSAYGHLEAMANGATTITGSDGSRWPTANELEGARYQGRRIAETAKMPHRGFGEPNRASVRA